MSDDSNRTNPISAAWGSLLVFALVLTFLLAHGDRTGFEGDDLNSVLPMLHLREAMAGNLLIYRPDWQPLSYQIGAATYTLTGSVDAIFALAQLSVAVGIAVLYRATRQVGLPAVLFVPLLLLFPEILYTGLYFNSSALGFPLVCIAVLLALEGEGRTTAAMTGAALATAVLVRIDFVLVAPMVVAFRLWLRRDLVDLQVLAGTAATVFAMALATGLLDLRGVIETYAAARAEIMARAQQPGWDDRAKVFAASVVLSPLGWAFLFGAMLWTAVHRRLWAPAAVGLLCMTPMLFAARNMLTPKYMIPALALMPVVVAIIWVAATEQMGPRMRRLLVVLWCLATGFYLVASVDPDNEAPFLILETRQSRQIETHDGPRSWGAYLWAMRNVASLSAERDTIAEDMLAALLVPRRVPIALVGEQNVFAPGGIAWRNLQLAAARAGHTGRLLGPGALVFDLPTGRMLLLTSEARMGHDLDGVCIIEILDEESRKTAASSIRACAETVM